MFERWRFKESFAFGRIEHESARILFVFILGTCAAYYFNRRDIELYFLVLDVVFWLIYFTAHNLEKALHPKDEHNRRI
jgi:hypothetical protein